MGGVVSIRPERSNHIARISYNPGSRDLAVTFTNQVTYTYGSVPPEVFAQMTRQQSMGEYFHRVIKRHYPLLKKSQLQEPSNGSDGTTPEAEGE